MSSILAIFNSSIGKKVLMSLTGLFLSVFLIVHLAGNLQLLKDDQGFAFNAYAIFMTTNPLIKFASYGLYAIILLHAFKGIALAISNKNSRTSKYVVNGSSKNSHWTSRNMGILGTIILAFIIVHMSDFWWNYKFGETPWTSYSIELSNGEVEANPIEAPTQKASTSYKTETHEYLVAKDLYKKVATTFNNPIFVLFYVLSMLSISFHLWHGFASAFQSLGASHPKYNGIVKTLGIVISVIIPLAFAVIPVFMYLTSLKS
jgi:succinate dehydrogenase / fumarate reductase, cytochrome b subunit